MALSRMILVGQGLSRRPRAINRVRHVSRRVLARDVGERWWERWSPGLPGVEVAGGDARRVRLAVDRSVDLAKVLGEAAQAAEVVRFDFEPPSLSEIFREAVRA